MRNEKIKGYTILELMAGMAVILLITGSTLPFILPMFKTLANSSYHEGLVQLNNIQQILRNDIELADQVESTGTTLILDKGGDRITYFAQNGSIIRRKTNNVHLNSDGMLVENFTSGQNENIVLIDLSVRFSGKQRMTIKDAVYCYGKK